MDVSPVNLAQEERILETSGIDDTEQPKIGAKGEGDFVEDDVVEDEEKELLEDELCRL